MRALRQEGKPPVVEPPVPLAFPHYRLEKDTHKKHVAVPGNYRGRLCSHYSGAPSPSRTVNERKAAITAGIFNVDENETANVVINNNVSEYFHAIKPFLSKLRMEHEKKGS